jgi:hypothetical protein
MATSSLIKSLLHKTIAEGVYKEILSNSSRYYYFLGRTLAWADETSPPYPINDLNYERETRNNIITLKQIQSNDVAFIVPRIDWTTNTVYDIYDDQYSTQVLGVNISAGGTNYLNVPTVTFDPPDLPGGTQATGTCSIYNNEVVAVTMTNKGSGYTNPPNVVFNDPSNTGSGAVGHGVIGVSSTGKFSIEESNFYVMTDEYNVYKCLDNNNGAESITKPIGTQVLPISLSDGYVWKYMFNVPIALRTKFLNDQYFPVVTALSQQFYSNGGIEAVKIESRGTNFTGMTLTVDGDGYLESDPVYLGSNSISSGGYGYVDGDTISIAPPYTISTAWTANTAVYLGNLVGTTTGKIYKVVQAGTTGSAEPSFRSGTVSDGTAALTFIGEGAKAYPSFSSFTVASTIAISGTTGQFTCGASALAVGQTIKITGTKGGTGTFTGYVSSNLYKVSAVTGTSPNVTGFTLTNTNGTAIATAAGTLTGLTFTAGAITAVNTLGGVREVNLTSYGSGYKTNPTVTFTAPSITFTANSTNVNTTSEVITIGSHWFSTGDKVTYSDGGGTTIGGLVNNTTYYVIKSSSTAIKLASSYANAIAGTQINLSSAGAGSAHTLTNSLNLPSAVSVISPTGVVQRINILDSGSNYTTAPTVTIGNPWTANTVVTLGTQYSVGTKLYTVTTAGTTGSTAPAPVGAQLGDTVTDGTAVLQWVGASAVGTAVLRYGYGYSGNPAILITTTTGTGFSAAFQSSKTNAKLIPLLENGQLVGVQIDNPGIGYSSATITATGDGTDKSCKLSPDISIGNINTLQANNELLTVPGTINNIQVISGGYNYGVATVQIVGDGIGATATATTVGGAVSKITITNQGSGYSYADIIINGNGSGASARSIISPAAGHGKDAYDELYVKTLMFYSNVSRDKNQGFDVNNDYRQVGILKNPRYYGKTNRFADPLGSGCFTVSGSYNTSLFTKDMLLTIPRTVDGNLESKRYIIVSTNSTGTSLLVSSLDGDTPQVGDQMTNSSNQFIGVAAVGAPTLDKYSGDMLFIDNKAGFTPSADETVTLRTIITF